MSKENQLFGKSGFGRLYQYSLAQQSALGSKKIQVAGNVPDELKSFKNGSLSVEQKLQLTKLIEAGEVFSMQLSLAVFRNRYPNLNYVRFRDKDLSALAKSSTGQPFLRDHNAYATADRVGTIDSGLLRSDGADKVIVQTVTLTDKRAMLDYVGGRLDRFSIGWNYKGLTCTVCEGNWRECTHYPGVEYDGVTCEVICEKPAMRETSYVNTPAVGGTGILSALSAAFNKRTRGNMTKKVATEEEVEADVASTTEENELSEAEQELDALADALGVPAIADRVLEHDETLSAYDQRISELEATLADRDSLISALQLAVDRLSGEPVGSFNLKGLTDLRKPAYAQRLANQVKATTTPPTQASDSSADKGKGKVAPGTNSGTVNSIRDRGKRFLNAARKN